MSKYSKFENLSYIIWSRENFFITLCKTKTIRGFYQVSTDDKGQIDFYRFDNKKRALAFISQWKKEH